MTVIISKNLNITSVISSVFLNLMIGYLQNRVPNRNFLNISEQRTLKVLELNT